jgi:hypothetical protein
MRGGAKRQCDGPLGGFLFDDADFGRFFARVCTTDGEPLLNEAARGELAGLGAAHGARAAGFVEFVLVRTPAFRPSAADGPGPSGAVKRPERFPM